MGENGYGRHKTHVHARKQIHLYVCNATDVQAHLLCRSGLQPVEMALGVRAVVKKKHPACGALRYLYGCACVRACVRVLTWACTSGTMKKKMRDACVRACTCMSMCRRRHLCAGAYLGPLGLGRHDDEVVDHSLGRPVSPLEVREACIILWSSDNVDARVCVFVHWVCR